VGPVDNRNRGTKLVTDLFSLSNEKQLPIGADSLHVLFNNYLDNMKDNVCLVKNSQNQMVKQYYTVLLILTCACTSLVSYVCPFGKHQILTLSFAKGALPVFCYILKTDYK